MSTPFRPRALAGVAMLAGTTLLVAGCGGGSTQSQSGQPTGACDKVFPGSTSDGVKVSGDIGKTPKVTFDKPLKATALQRTIVTKGKGAAVTKGEQINAEITLMTGDGKTLGTQPVPIIVGSSSVPKAFLAGVACLPIGSRSVVTDSAKDVYGPSGYPNLGIKATDSLVIVTDVVSEKTTIKPGPWTKAPTVNLKGKTPKVTLPKGGAPKALLEKVVTPGTGATVKIGDKVQLDYQGQTWNGKVFDQSYGHAPITMPASQFVEGFTAALVGQKVGATVLVNIPDQYGYGPTKSADNPLGGQTLVFLIQIKGVSAG